MTGPSLDHAPATAGEDATASLAAALRQAPGATLPVILCFFTGPQPAAASAMPRDPAPRTGMSFDEDFAVVLAEAVGANTAVHDGAIMMCRVNPGDAYAVVGWSYRLHPPQAGATHPNKGSAFNSCVAMSALEGIDQLLLVTRDGTFRFRQGRAESLI